MKSKIIALQNSGQGFVDAQKETEQFALEEAKLSNEQTLLCA